MRSAAGCELAASDGGGRGRGRGGCPWRRPTSSPAAPITPTTLSTGTVSPSRARIASSTPAAGAGISASTLSVEISNSGSSRSTASPTLFIQRTMVPSAIDSPIWGMTTDVGMGGWTGLELYRWMAAPCAAWAASPTASENVGCA